jgi:hypothetical protein
MYAQECFHACSSAVPTGIEEVVSQAVAVRDQSSYVSTTQGEKEEGYHVYTWTPL